ncbi:MAG: dockerin type I domain-containing protein [Verrucomicrobiota bacterium]
MLNQTLNRLILPVLLVFCTITAIAVAQTKTKSTDTPTVTLEKMLVANGTVAMNVDLNRLKGGASEKAKPETLRFTVSPESFFTALVSDSLLRGPEPSSMALASQNSAALPAALKASLNQLVIEKLGAEESFDLIVRDGRTGFVFFNVDGHSYDYDAAKHVLSINGGRLLLSPEFAKNLGVATQAGSVAGTLSVVTTVYPIEVQKLVNGTVKSDVMPARTVQPAVGTVPGPDVIVGDLPAVTEPSGASNGNFVGLGVGTTSCNQGVVDLDWFQMTNTDHPVIPQNLYRMSANTDRFEQIGQSWLKHAFTALTENICSLGCNGTGGSHLGSGCSDPYSSSLNASQGSGTASGLGSRAWVNPFTGAFPSTAANHSNHSHTGTTHRVLVDVSDLNTSLNAGASYFAEGQYVTPHEYAWCQTHAGQCNMYNNVSYRQFSVTGTGGPFSFAPVGATQRTKPAILAWTGATVNQFEPVPGTDGIGMIACKVTNPSAGVYHYEYVVYNENLDRSIQSFSVPLGCVTPTNLGFHAPPQHPGIADDGTVGSAGYSGTPWTANQTVNAVTWNCETFATNQNANAIRWGTLYNFRFDANQPPQAANATVGFFKTGSPITVATLAPTACAPLQITSVVSRKIHGGAGTFDVPLPLSGQPGIECRSTGGDFTFVFTFNNAIASGNASVTAGTGNVSGRTISGNTMRVDLIGVTDDQRITVSTSSVMDTFGQTLPDTTVNADILMGDTNANDAVNASDVAQTKSQIGLTISTTNFREDTNANGAINASDVSQIKGNIGKSVP